MFPLLRAEKVYLEGSSDAVVMLHVSALRRPLLSSSAAGLLKVRDHRKLADISASIRQDGDLI